MDIWLGLFTDTHTSCGNIKCTGNKSDFPEVGSQLIHIIAKGVNDAETRLFTSNMYHYNMHHSNLYMSNLNTSNLHPSNLMLMEISH